MVRRAFALVAGAAGYVLSARTGRDRFEQIKEQANRVWIQHPVERSPADC